MSTPWWKGAPPPTTPTLDPDAKPWAEEPGRPATAAPTGFEATKLRCSAPGCAFEGDASTTATLGGGLRPFCQHHATGGELVVADLIWKLPCACGRAADGFSQVVGGFSASHNADKCLERTVAANPDDVTVPAGSGLPTRPIEGAQVFTNRKCACGKRLDGMRDASEGFVESHTVRECIEQTRM